MINPTKDNFTQALSIKKILDERKISKDDYARALSISNDEDLEQHLKRQPDSLFFKNLFLCWFESLADKYGYSTVVLEY